MTPDKISVGCFVQKIGRPDYVREILHIGQDGNVIYRDRYATAVCRIQSLARWAEGEVPRPSDWIAPGHTARARLHARRKTRRKRTNATRRKRFSPALSELAKVIVRQAFRDTDIEDLHASEYDNPPPGSKVVFPDGTTIPWEEASHITDAQMRSLMIEAVNKVYTIICFPVEMVSISRRIANVEDWNDAELDPGLMHVIAEFKSVQRT